MTRMFQTIVHVDPWDLVDEGIDAVLDRLAGEAGATGISVTLSAPAAAYLRPHQGVHPRTFRSEGGLQFQPAKDAYAATRLRPLTAEWLKKSNPLIEVAQACQDRGLTLRGRIVCCQSDLLAPRFDFAAAKDVFGDRHPGWLCPANPDVRAFLRALVADLAANLPTESLELVAAGFPPPADWNAHRDAGFDAGPAGQWLLSLCFCESCRQAAADVVDVAAAARSATVILEPALKTGEPVAPSVADLLADDPILRAFAEWRAEQVMKLIGLMKNACGCRLLLNVGPDAWTPDADLAAVAGRCDALVASAATEEAVEPAIRQARTAAGADGRVEISIEGGSPGYTESASLVRSFSTAVRMGLRCAVVGSYGRMPLARLEWIKQAARYALRESQ
ncbi:MAG: hypothetical protein AMXMBFR83_22300 [Phycisphaerae bacterium]